MRDHLAGRGVVVGPHEREEEVEDEERVHYSIDVEEGLIRVRTQEEADLKVWG